MPYQSLGIFVLHFWLYKISQKRFTLQHKQIHPFATSGSNMARSLTHCTIYCFLTSFFLYVLSCTKSLIIYVVLYIHLYFNSLHIFTLVRFLKGTINHSKSIINFRHSSLFPYIYLRFKNHASLFIDIYLKWEENKCKEIGK